MTFDRDAIRGEVNIALRALGALAEDPVVEEMRALATHPFAESEFADPDDGTITTFTDAKGGFDYRVIDGRISQVTFHLRADRHRDAYPRPEVIVEGLNLTEVSAAEVEALFGPAYKSLAGIASKYQVDGEIVHIGWRAPGASSLVVMHDVGKK